MFDDNSKKKNLQIQTKKSWRHQFRTPKKLRRRRQRNSKDGNENSIVEEVTIPSNSSRSPKSKQLLPKPDLEPESKVANSSHLVLTNGIMKSIVAGTSYVEQDGGLTIKDLQKLSSVVKISRKIKVHNKIFDRLLPFVNECIDHLLHEEMHQIEDFDSLLAQLSSKFNVNIDNDRACIVTLAIKGALYCCKPLVPQLLYKEVMTIEDGSEIETLLSLQKWPNLTSMAFILILHHLTKLCNMIKTNTTNEDEGLSASLDFTKRLSHIYGETLLKQHQDYNPSPKLRQKKQYRHRTKEEVLQLMMTHFAHDVNVDNGTKKFDQKVNAAPSTSSTSLLRDENIANQVLKSSTIGKDDLRHEDSITEPISLDCVSTDPTQNNNNTSVDSMKTSSFPKQVINNILNVSQDNVTTSTSDYGSSNIDDSNIDGDDDDMKKLCWWPYDDNHVLSKTKKRIEVAEAVLHRIECRCELML
jgi:hypothetical protein